ncbi:MAG: DNA primase [bacterium]|nr:DNA primase [bacterium]
MTATRENFSDFKETVRSATDVVELVGQYLRLKRTGSNWQGLCPFHNEKTPSFNVNQERQNYYCFGCHKGGDVFSFVMEQEGLEFREALEFLAKRAGIAMPKSYPRSGERSRQELFYRINEASAEFYHKLLTRSPQGKIALEYLHKRGISDQSIEDFQLGFAVQSWRQLYEFLSKSDFPADKCVEAGLIRRKSSGPGYYDSFRNRIIFPVRSVAGRVLGFGARVMDDSLPKYINSIDSPVYTKKRILYGLDRAWREIRREKEALLVEGYFDVISLTQSGIPLAVAACGTAFSEEQAKLLGRYTERVSVVTDGDAAGQKAGIKVAGIVLKSGGRPNIVGLDADEDPDSLIRKEGLEAFQARIRDAAGYFGYMRELVAERGDKPASRERAIRRILEDLAFFQDGDLRLESLLAELADTFGVEIRVLKRALGETRRPETRRRPEQSEGSLPEKAAVREDDRAELIEKRLLRVLLHEGEDREKLLKLLRPEYFSDPVRARLFSNLVALGRVPGSRELGEIFPDPAATAAINELTFLEMPGQSKDNWVQASALRLKLKALLELNRDFQGRVQAMELAGEPVPADLLGEWRHVGEAIRSLRAEIDQVLEKQKGS